MNRILRRPMFRMGGTPNEGIMTGLKEPRLGYSTGTGPGLEELIAGEALKQEQGPYFTEPFIKGQFEEFKSDLFKDPNEDVGIAALGGYGFIEAPDSPKISGVKRLVQEQPEKAYNLFKQGKLDGTNYAKKQQTQEKISKEAGLNINFGLNIDKENAPDAVTEGPKENKPTITIPKEGKEPSDEETLKSYMDMFSKAFKDSPEDISRQRYLELARFGANLLAQPGGSLTAAIGRAAAPAIEGLTKSELARKAGEKEVKLAALQTAIRQMDNPTMDKINALAKASNMSKSEVAKNLILDRTADTTKQDRIKITQAALQGELGAGPALKIAQALEADNAVLAQAEPIEIDKETKKPKEGVADGYYYDESGKLYKVTDGKPAIVKIQKEK
jgi:transcriptional regulator with XRE-family HTH domain